MANNAEHPLICSFSIYNIIFSKMAIRVLVHFLIGLFAVLLLSCESSFYILVTSPLWDMQFANIF